MREIVLELRFLSSTPQVFKLFLSVGNNELPPISSPPTPASSCLLTLTGISWYALSPFYPLLRHYGSISDPLLLNTVLFLSRTLRSLSSV